jgi:hypothetical protein
VSGSSNPDTEALIRALTEAVSAHILHTGQHPNTFVLFLLDDVLASFHLESARPLTKADIGGVLDRTLGQLAEILNQHETVEAV